MQNGAHGSTMVAARKHGIRADVWRRHSKYPSSPSACQYRKAQTKGVRLQSELTADSPNTQPQAPSLSLPHFPRRTPPESKGLCRWLRGAKDGAVTRKPPRGTKHEVSAGTGYWRMRRFGPPKHNGRREMKSCGRDACSSRGRNFQATACVLSEGNQ